MISWNQKNYSTDIVFENKMIAPFAYLLRFKRNFSFAAGQVIGLGINTEIEPRLYSIASGETDEFVDILYTEKPNGQLTPMLSHLKKGDKILSTPPFGTFTEYASNGVLVATGTGIAPFMSMLKSGKGKNATLIHGVRTPEYFYFEDFFKESLKDNYIQCCSRYCSTNYYDGRVTTYLQEHPVNPDKKYYLCGVAEMVVEARDILISKGIPFGNIISEIYF
jgi:ferredoxin/flavodoxin---NADP+ reductase